MRHSNIRLQSRAVMIHGCGDASVPHHGLLELNWKKRKSVLLYCSLAYSALACFTMGMSGSASFQTLKKS
jgi:hypothetical protein